MNKASRVGLALALAMGARAAHAQALAEIARGTGQVLGPVAERSDSAAWSVWASVGLLSGGIRSPEHSRSSGADAGTLSIWATYHRLALSVRSMGMPIYVEQTRGVGDRAILAGVHLPVGLRSDLVVAVGGGESGGTGYLVPANAEGVFAAAAQLDVSYRFVGVGLEAMAGVGSTRRYAAAGVAFSLGWFR